MMKAKNEVKLKPIQYGTIGGNPHPLGATVVDMGVNFCLFSKNALGVDLCLFKHADDEKPFQVISLKASRNRSFHYWHVLIKDLPVGTLYGYQVYGPFDTAAGHRFDQSRLLLDPYARAIVTPKAYNRLSMTLISQTEVSYSRCMKCVVVDPWAYDWKGDEHVHHPYSRSVIYEVHLKGFTRHPTSEVENSLQGTYTALVKKIPYLKKLGITTIELMPVTQFDPQDVPHGLLNNYWGYSPIAFFAPHNGYCYCHNHEVIADEFRNMVRALHKANIEVILDVVFNHTAEGNEGGPTLSFKGIENDAYYILSHEKGHYMDYSGCGNTFNTNHSVVRRLIMDALRRWVVEMHIDGFRFDLASIMSRDVHGNPMKHPPILWEIESDPVLASTKIIAEAWDAGGLYQVGSFVGDKWAEWNGRFRDDIRRFLRGDSGAVKDFANRIAGSPDLYNKPFRDPNRSINMITCHDGFTLNDLVSYNHKHNEANGENNRDGCNENYSWNHGVEGPTKAPEVEALRLRQIKNFMVLLLLSQGTPMISMGDEVRRTQGGNNNAYCQDNEISWFDWSLVGKNKELLAFVQHLIRLNQSQKIFRMDRFWGEKHERGSESITWHGVKLFKPDWSYHSHSLAYHLKDEVGDFQYHFMINAWHQPLTFELPQTGQKWYRIIDTFQDDSFSPFGNRPVIENTYTVMERSVTVLMSKLFLDSPN